MKPQDIVDLIDELPEEEHLEFMTVMFEKYHLQYQLAMNIGDTSNTTAQDLFTVELTEVPESTRKVVVKILHSYWKFSGMNIMELWNKTKELPLVLLTREYETHVDELCDLIEGAGGIVNKFKDGRED